MHLCGRALIIVVASASLALAASAQQQPQQKPPTFADQAERLKAQLFAQADQLKSEFLTPAPQQRKPRFVRAQMREARLLALDMQGARTQARAPINQRGKAINLRFIAANKVLIDQISIPVLLPSEPPLAEHLRIFPNEAHYAISSTGQGGLSFHMTGHGKAFDLMPAAVRRLPHADLRARIPADGVVIEHTEFGLDASFNRFGAAYSISLECADPADPRCTNDGYIRSLISRLMVVIPGDSQ